MSVNSATHSSPDQSYYAGLDAQQAYVVVAVVDKQGTVVHQARVLTTEPTRLVDTLAPYYTPSHPLAVVVETCPFWLWLYDVLVPRGMDFHLAHAQELKAIARAAHKSDQRDARLLARMLAGGLIPEAYAKPPNRRPSANRRASSAIARRWLGIARCSPIASTASSTPSASRCPASSCSGRRRGRGFARPPAPSSGPSNAASSSRLGCSYAA